MPEKVINYSLKSNLIYNKFLIIECRKKINLKVLINDKYSKNF